MNNLELEAYRLRLKEANIDELLDDYGMYYRLKHTHLFDEEIALIREEIKRRLDKGDIVICDQEDMTGDDTVQFPVDAKTGETPVQLLTGTKTGDTPVSWWPITSYTNS